MNLDIQQSIDVVVTGHPLVCAGLKSTFDGSERTAVVGIGSIEDLPDLLGRVERAPHVVVLVSSGDDSVLVDRIRATRAAIAELPIVVVLQSVEPEVAVAVLRSGANGCLVLDADEREIVSATVAAAHGGAPIDARLARYVIDDAMGGTRREEQLTSREAEVLEGVLGGLSNKQIARQLGISEPTVKAYLTRVYQRLGVRSRTEAAMWAESRRQGSRPFDLAS